MDFANFNLFLYSVLIQARHNKAISRDTWSQLLEFARVRRYEASKCIHVAIFFFIEISNSNIHAYPLPIMKKKKKTCMRISCATSLITPPEVFISRMNFVSRKLEKRG